MLKMRICDFLKPGLVTFSCFFIDYISEFKKQNITPQVEKRGKKREKREKKSIV